MKKTKEVQKDIYLVQKFDEDVQREGDIKYDSYPSQTRTSCSRQQNKVFKIFELHYPRGLKAEQFGKSLTWSCSMDL